MKVLLLSFLFLLGACNSEDPSEESETPVATPTPPPPPKDILLNASRDYGPSSWNPMQVQAPVDGTYSMPSELLVLAGNSGTGWASIKFPSKKYCYQGNASNNNTPNGTKFILKHQSNNIEDPCYANPKDPASSTQMILANDIIELNISGGGCASHCEFTEIEALLEVIP